MPHLPHRSLALSLVAAGASLTLAACGSPAINTNFTPGANPTNSTSGGISRSPSPQASKSASGKASTHASSPAHSTAPKAGGGTQSVAPSGSHTSSGGSGGTHTVAPSAATITVTPWENLASGQVVTIHGSHFNPKTQVIAVECINKGSSTQANNCNINILALPKGFYPAANGTFTVTLKVVKKFGSNTCSSSTPCLVSVTEPNNNPTEEADTPIRFS